MSRTAIIYTTLMMAASCSLSTIAPAFAEEAKAKVLPKEQTSAPDQQPPKKESAKGQDMIKIAEVPIENVVAVTSEQLANKPQDYLNKNVKFTAPFFAFSNLGLDYKPAFRSSRTYLSFLVLRPNSHTPFSEIKLDLLIPKEKDPQTKMLQTLREGDTVEIIGRVFACPLDEPWLDVARLKKIASVSKKGDNSEDKAADDKDSSDDQSGESK